VVQGKIIAVALSKGGALIRLTEKQWMHVIASRPQLEDFQREIMEVIERPDVIFAPPPRVRSQLHAVKKFKRLRDLGLGENLVVVYRELTLKEGFIITAFPISDRRKRRMYRLWRRL
jgi:hypothetical protein